MQLRVLGPIELEGATLGPQERVLVARLVVGLGQTVHEGELVAALWPDVPPRTAAKTLQGIVLRVRKALTAAVDAGEINPVAIATSTGGYALTASDSSTFAARVGVSEETALAAVMSCCAPVWDLQGRLDELEQLLAAPLPAEGEWVQLWPLFKAGLRARQGRLDEAADLLGPSVPAIERGRNWGCGVDDATMAVVRGVHGQALHRAHP